MDSSGSKTPGATVWQRAGPEHSTPSTMYFTGRASSLGGGEHQVQRFQGAQDAGLVLRLNYYVYGTEPGETRAKGLRCSARAIT